MSRLPLQPLQGFVLAARLRNLSRAAEALHLTVSALSHQIRALEERLGQRLFTRGPRGIALTADGQRLFEAVSEPFAAIERALQPHAGSRDDVLTLSLLPSMAGSWLVPRLGDFLARHPQLVVNLQSSVALVDFERDRDIDAALRYGPGRWPGLQAVHLFDDWASPLASPELIARFGGELDLRDLSRYPLLDDRGSRWSDWFTAVGGTAPTRFVAVFDDSEALHRAAAAGMGVVMGRLSLARPLLDAGRLVELSPLRVKSEFAHYLVYPPRSAEHRGLLAFRDWLLEQAAAYNAALAPPPVTRTREHRGKAPASRRKR